MSSEPKVLFINKGLTSRSLTRSVGAERSRIFSHVQRPSQNRLPSSSLLCSKDPSPGSVSCTRDAECVTGSSSCSYATSKSSSSDCGVLAKKQRVKAKDLARRPSPLIAVSIAQLDLFGSPAAPITNYMDAVLEFYSGPMLQRIYPNRLLADVSRQHTLSYAAEDEVVLNAILCTTSGALYMHYGSMKHAYHAMYFKGQAIRSLKQEISRKEDCNISMSTLYAVSLLLWVECLEGDMGAVEAHIKGLDHMVNSVTGFCDTPLPILTTILSSSYYSAAMLGNRPVLAPPVGPSDISISLPTLETLNLWNSAEFSKLGSRFFTPSNSAVIGPRLLQLISTQRQFMLFKQLSTLERLNATYSDIECIYNIEMATEYQLLNMPYDNDRETITPTQDALRLALYINSQPIITVAKPTAAFSRYMSKQLKDALESIDMSELWETNSDLLLWILFIGARISYSQVEWTWLVSRMTMAVANLEVESFEKLQSILAEFYYCFGTCDQTLEYVWRDIKLSLNRTDA